MFIYELIEIFENYDVNYEFVEIFYDDVGDELSLKDIAIKENIGDVFYDEFNDDVFEIAIKKYDYDYKIIIDIYLIADDVIDKLIDDIYELYDNEINIEIYDDDEIIITNKE